MLKPQVPRWRIGEGWDIHALVTGRKLILGGVEIPHTHGLKGHSDADALCHAITDALFGAAAMGDIGRHFPDTDPQFQGADSLALLTETARRIRAAGWLIGNVDSTIVAQAPKMAPNIPAMPFVVPEVRNDPAVYPPEAVRLSLHKGVLHSPKEERARSRLWSRVKTGL